LEPEATKRISKNLRILMWRGGWNQLRLAKACGVKQPTIHHILRGGHMPKVATLVKLAAFFEMEYDALVWRELDDPNWNWKGIRVPLLDARDVGREQSAAVVSPEK
jgi:transcriptional regulator with XRE-family HTH domain